MEKYIFTVSVKIDAKLFCHFALFDTFYRQRRWVSPAIFAGIMLFFSGTAFSLRGRAEQTELLGGVLLAVGLVLPIVYFFSYLLSIRAQIKKMRLTAPRPAYTLRLGNGVEVSTEKEHAAYRWDEMYAAYRTARCIYLYASPQRAYILPDAQIVGETDALWNFLKTVLPSANLHNCRGRIHR